MIDQILADTGQMVDKRDAGLLEDGRAADARHLEQLRRPDRARAEDDLAIGADRLLAGGILQDHRSEEHTSELQSLMRISYAVFCLKKKKTNNNTQPCEAEADKRKNT